MTKRSLWRVWGAKMAPLPAGVKYTDTVNS